MVAINFTPVVRRGYRIGVPTPGPYREVMNSDDPKYGGSGVRNPELTPGAEECFGYPYSFELTLPPLAGTILEPTAAQALRSLRDA